MSEKIEINLGEVFSFVKKYYYITLIFLALGIFFALFSPLDNMPQKKISNKLTVKYNIIDALAFQKINNHLKDLNQIINACNQLEIYFKYDFLDDIVLEKQVMQLFNTCTFLSGNSFMNSDEAYFFNTFLSLIRNSINNPQMIMSINSDFAELKLELETFKIEDIKKNLDILNNIEFQNVKLIREKFSEINQRLLIVNSYLETISNEKIDLIILRSLILKTLEDYILIIDNSEFSNFISRKIEIEDNSSNLNQELKDESRRSIYVTLVYSILISLFFGISISVIIGYFFKTVKFIK